MVRIFFLLMILSGPLLCLGETPHSVIITKHDIKSSMATSLNELLEIYAPDYLYLVDSKYNTRVASRGFVSENQQTALYLNDIPTSMTLANGSQWGFELPFLEHIDSIKIECSDNPLLSASGTPFGSIYVYMNPMNSISLLGETGFSYSKQEGVKTSASLSIKHKHSQHQLYGSYQRQKGIHRNRLFGSAAKNKLDPTTYIFPVGDTGAIITSTNPFHTEGDALFGYSFQREGFQLQSLAIRTDHQLGAFKILKEHQSHEERIQLLNQAVHEQTIRNSTLTSRIGYNFYSQNYFADTSTKGSLKSNEHQLSLSTCFSLPQTDPVYFSTGISGTISLMNDTSSFQHNAATLWTGFQFAPQRRIKPGLHFSATRSSTTNLSLNSQIHIAAAITPKHSLQYSMSSMSSHPTGIKNRNSAKANPYNPYPDKWSYTNGHLFDSLFVDSLVSNEYQLGNIIPPVSSESPQEKYYTLSLESAHTLTKNCNLKTQTSLQQIKGYLFYNSRDKIFQSGPEISTLSASIGLRGNPKKWHYTIVQTYSRLLKQKATMITLNTPTATPLWDTLHQIWVPTEVDTSSLVYEDMATYLFAEDTIHLNNIPTLVTKLTCGYTINDRVSVSSNGRIFWGLRGREGHHQRSITSNPGDNHLQLDSKPIIKLHTAVQISLPKKFQLCLSIRNILGSEKNRQAVRWTELHSENEAPYYTVDRRTYAIYLEKEL